MLSSKLKSWMESHLTRKKSSGSSSKKSASGYHGGGTTTSSGSYKELSPADRIAHPASSLVNLVPAVPLCSTSGRSNAGLVIRLQNDFREHQHSSSQSPCHLRQQQHHHPSWTRSPVMLAWNTKIPPTPIPLHKDPPLSPPPSSSSSTIIQQVCRQPECCCCTSLSYRSFPGKYFSCIIDRARDCARHKRKLDFPPVDN